MKAKADSYTAPETGLSPRARGQAGRLLPPFALTLSVTDRNPERLAAYHPVGDDVRVHPHLWVHTDQVPPEGLTLQLLPQSLPCSDVPDVNS